MSRPRPHYSIRINRWDCTIYNYLLPHPLGFVSNMVGYDTLSRIYEQMCSYSRAWTYILNRQATYEWTYSLLSISNAMDYPTHYFMPSIDSFYDERLCQSPTRIYTKMLIDDCSENHVVCVNLIDTTFLLNEPRFPNFKV